MPSNLEQATKNRAEIAEIKHKLDSGEINYYEAKRLAQPILDRINARCEDIAAKHGQKAYKIDFVSVIRNSY